MLRASAVGHDCQPAVHTGFQARCLGRWLDTVYLPTCKELQLRHMYEAMDMLHAHCTEVEETVFFHVANLFNLEVDLIFYDTTHRLLYD